MLRLKVLGSGLTGSEFRIQGRVLEFEFRV